MINKTRRAATDLSVSIGLAIVLTFFVICGVVAYLNTRTLNNDAKSVARTHETLMSFGALLSALKDAETGQRGFIITGNEDYLAPYAEAVRKVDVLIADIERRTAEVPEQQSRLPLLKQQVREKINELAKTVTLRRTEGFERAQAVVIGDTGKNAMDSIRGQVQAMEETERGLRAERIAEMNQAYLVAVVSGIVTSALGVIISIVVGYLIHTSISKQRREDWLQNGQVGVAASVIGDRRIELFGENLLTFLAEYLGACSGAFFVKDEDAFRRVATYGLPVEDGIPETFVLGEGLLGQAAKDGRSFSINNVPDGYISVASALGRSKPTHLLIAPFKTYHGVSAVIELGFLHPLPSLSITLCERVSEQIAVAVRSANYRAHLHNLLEETQRQSEELQSQSEELRVSNEELEEQGRALRESQSRLEQQQAELEQTNAQLEEQAQLLEVERDTATAAKADLQVKARELEQASRYKSDFLANMSHELRTPLNSSLILSKLLADNPTGNLTAEQVQYAETIASAGNDLLTLINDILDLSKIEAGHMDLHLERVEISDVVEGMRRIFAPIAGQKGLSFKLSFTSDSPGSMETDRQRLEQVLKNLLSNALKFTENGEVELSVGRTKNERVVFIVKDTGIGIDPHQQEMVFEAFRQADGTTNRKYGGTGLGLSISRELTRLLAGELHLESTPGKGSTFTITLPSHYDPKLVEPRMASHLRPSFDVGSQPFVRNSPNEARTESATVTPRRSASRIQDDREILVASKRTILIIEDDDSFAKIMLDLAHELDFQCLIATTAEEGLAMTVQHRPGAVLLDVGLPDHSGLSVLDRLKHDARTRHIPVHVVSAGDYAQTALSLGAAGYILKPVMREQLSETFKLLEARLEKVLRRILIVEDDPVQLDGMKRLLGAHDVETIGASSAAECLDILSSSEFDCMVLDLTLPDASGYALLETLSREDQYAFPPVIVYTGRELSQDEEQRLRRYSKSIIIKGAKSPERLLDEVTLFLHQVVSDLPAEQQRMIEKARNRDAALEGRRILVAEDDVRNVFALTSILEPRGAFVQIARNGPEAIAALEQSTLDPVKKIDLVLMDIMMPEMDGISAIREIRKRSEWKRIPIIALTAKAMKDDQEQCLSAGANDYMAKPLDVEKLVSLVRVWMPR